MRISLSAVVVKSSMTKISWLGAWGARGELLEDDELLDDDELRRDDGRRGDDELLEDDELRRDDGRQVMILANVCPWLRRLWDIVRAV